MERLAVLHVGGTPVHLLGTIPGLAAEADLVRNVFARAAPRVVALGVGPEDVRTLRSLGAREAVEDEFDTSAYEDQLLTRLRQFGEVRLPPPDLVEAVRAADERSVPIEALDLDDAAYSDLYTKEVGLFQLWRNNRRIRGAGSLAFPTESPEAFIVAWDREFTKAKGYRRIEEAREETMARRLAEVARLNGATLAVVPLARLEGIRKRLTVVAAQR
jgi:hypothetical protein